MPPSPTSTGACESAFTPWSIKLETRAANACLSNAMALCMVVPNQSEKAKHEAVSYMVCGKRCPYTRSAGQPACNLLYSPRGNLPACNLLYSDTPAGEPSFAVCTLLDSKPCLFLHVFVADEAPG